MTDKILKVRNLSVAFAAAGGAASVVDGISFDVAAGETVGLVGESGSGKSVTAMAVMGLLPRAARVRADAVRLCGQELTGCSERQLRQIRGPRAAMIFQEPMTALNPVWSIGNQMTEVLRRHRGLSRRAARASALEWLSTVGMPDPRRRLDEYPHQLSGGQRQRVMIAMAMSCHPRLLIADEPTTALDVTTQAQILDLILKLQRDTGTAVLLITHDLGVVAETCRRALVMCRGEIVEAAPVAALFSNPGHAYTRSLLDAMLVIEE